MEPSFSVKDRASGAGGDGRQIGGEGGDGEESFISLMWIVGGVSSVIIVIVFVILGIYVCKKSRAGAMSGDAHFLAMHGGGVAGHRYSDSSKLGTPTGKYMHSPTANGKCSPTGVMHPVHHTNGTIRGSGGASMPPDPMTMTMPMYKTCHTDDPVELRRINFPTSELEFYPALACGEFADYVDRLKAKENHLFKVEYESIEPGQQFTWEHSNLEENKCKNRYANVIAYDHSRVHLKFMDGVPGSDYINANHMDGYRKKNAYISTQGPLAETLADFWRMVWEQKSYTIVMMTKLEEKSRAKCDQYWPSRDQEKEVYGNIEVFLELTEVLATHTIRTLKVRHVKETSQQGSREVRQYQFTGWPDHGVPEHPTPVLNFIQKVKMFNPPNAGPIVVHCSAGVGRTGCFIVIDTQLEKMRNEDMVDVYGHVTCLRAQRQYMVQTEDQYIFIYDALLEAIQSGNTEFHVHQLPEKVASLRNNSAYPGDIRTGIESEFERLSNVKQAPAKFVSANLPENKEKNRLANIKPYETTRVKLQQIRGQSGSDYINASFIDGYLQKSAYIATQGPLENTVFDFWRMLWETNSCVVVMLTKLKELGREKCWQYWPDATTKGGLSVRYNFLVVEPVQEYAMNQFIVRELRVTDARDGTSRVVRQFHYDWPEQGVPKNTEMFIEFIGSVHKSKQHFGLEGPITVHCSSGSARTGVFVALKIVLERMQSEGLVDVFQTVKMLRTQRPAMVQTEDQYEFIYQAALDYYCAFRTYDTYNSSNC